MLHLPVTMTGSIRLFVHAPLTAGVEIEATAAQAHYLGNVMRRVPGDPVALFNGSDGEWQATIAALRRESARFAVTMQRRAQAAEPDLWLVFAPLKRGATDLVVQKATELGASALLPVQTERTNTNRINRVRLQAIAMEAAEQSERLTVPHIEVLRPLLELLGGWPVGRTLFAAMEREPVPRLRPTGEPAALLVGPEGGFSPAELDALRRHPLVVAASLGPRVLRAETAALAGLVLLQAETGR